MIAKNFRSVFSRPKTVIGMIHGKGSTDREILDIAKEEIRLYMECHVDTVLIENYFCDVKHVDMILKWASNFPRLTYGVNILGNDSLNFQLAREYDCDFMQIDSVCGHLPEESDKKYCDFIQRERSRCKAILIGGVRFKYQPVLSERTLEEDLKLGMERCDVIAVTGDATGQETNIRKIWEFFRVLDNFPLIVGAGTTADNIKDQLHYSIGCITGSYFKDNHRAEGNLNKDYIRLFMSEVLEAQKG